MFEKFKINENEKYSNMIKIKNKKIKK